MKITVRRSLRGTALAVALLSIAQSGCIVVGGYSSRGGWFLWPGGFGLLILIVLLFLFFGRR